MKKRTVLLVAILSAIVVTALAVGAFVYITNSRSDRLLKESKETLSNAVNVGCAGADLTTLENQYNKLSDAQQKADIAAVISQCASIDFKDMPKAITWAKLAADNYEKVGNTEKADSYRNYAVQFEQLMETGEQQSTQDEKKGDYTL